MKEQKTPDSWYFKIGILVPAVMAMAGAAFLKIWLSNSHNWVYDIAPALIGIGFSIFAAYWARLVNRNPYPLRVALLGPPRCGKTVFLTVLFRELEVFSSPSIQFEPYGIETIEAVSNNLATLSSGRWLNPTSVNSVFFFRANAVLGSGLLKEKYTLEIGDYAGERLAEFDSSNEQWLHRTEYFDYAVRSDIIFLGVDGGDMSADGIESAQQKLLAALQMLIEKKGVSHGNRLKAPIGLLILKSDLLALSDTSVEDVQNRLARLISVCERRCENFRCFFVSSIGKTENLDPPKVLHPDSVIEPMLWGLRRAKPA